MPAPIVFTSPLPPEALRFESLTATQAVSALDSIEVTLVSDKADIAAEKLLGEPAGVKMALREGAERHFNGLVARVAAGHMRGRYFGYQVTLRPWLWFLTRTSDCRIFQDLTVPEIVEQVFGDHGAIANYEFKLYKSYRQRVYCVQYRETDYNFVARLLEEEGIYWFFEHTQGSHKLVLVDDVGALSTAEGAEKLPYYDNAGQLPPDLDYVSGWSCAREVRSGKVCLTSYNFEKPTTPLRVEQAQARSHALDDYEQFDFDGEYTEKPDGQHLADCQLEEQQAQFERLAGSTNAAALTVGHLFELERHPRPDQNAEHLCLQSSVSVRVEAHESGLGAEDYRCSFTAMPSAQPFRPPRRTPKPFVQGPQTAVVVGPSGDEIFTDKYGRVKVKFHWDRADEKNEKSSCFVRVSSPWAGKSFGFVQVPRIGQEVIVDFLEGDPDQPIITGRVYNADNMPPWELPANATQSGVLTRSSKGGAYGNANAIRFEDKKGSEQLWIHAEKNQDIEVENDETHWVGQDRTKTIDHDETTLVKHDRTETVGNDERITIGRDQTELIGRDRSVAVAANHTETIGRSMSITVATTLTETVGVNYAESVGGAMELTVGGAIAITAGAAMAETVGGVKSESVGGAKTEEIGAGKSVTVGANLTDSVRGNRDISTEQVVKQTVGEDYKLTVAKVLGVNAKKVQIVADDEISLKAGNAQIVLKKNGDITIKGGKIKIEASGDMVLKGSKIKEN